MRVACVYIKETGLDVTTFAEACLRFSPQICLGRNQTVFIEIGKCLGLYSEQSFLLRMNALLRKFNYLGSVAIGDHLMESLLKAKYGTASSSQLGLEALHELNDPFHFDLKIEKSIESMRIAFVKLGIKNLAEWLNLPPSSFSSRFGKIAILCRERFLAETMFTWPEWKPEEVIQESQDLLEEERCETVEPLLFISKHNLDRIFSRLKGRGVRLAKLKIQGELKRNSTVKIFKREWIFEFMLPVGSSASVIPILRERWEREFSKNPLKASMIHLDFIVLETTNEYEMQKNLFHTRDEHETSLQAVISYLSEILGKNNVFKVKLKEERLAEYSWEKTQITQAPLSKWMLPLRPTRLFSKPISIQIKDGKILVQNKTFTITHFGEVERICDHWLDGVQPRNYHRVQIIEGPPLWIFEKEVAFEKKYYLHGYYE